MYTWAHGLVSGAQPDAQRTRKVDRNVYLWTRHVESPPQKNTKVGRLKRLWVSTFMQPRRFCANCYCVPGRTGPVSKQTNEGRTKHKSGQVTSPKPKQTPERRTCAKDARLQPRCLRNSPERAGSCGSCAVGKKGDRS